MAEIDMNKLRILAESAERRAGELHKKYLDHKDAAYDARKHRLVANAVADEKTAASLLNDFFYWSGKATSYRGIIAMMELQEIVEDEINATPSCP